MMRINMSDNGVVILDENRMSLYMGISEYIYNTFILQIKNASSIEELREKLEGFFEEESQVCFGLSDEIEGMILAYAEKE